MAQLPKVRSFRTPEDWERWLAKNYALQEGVWLRFYKKASGVKSMNYTEALDGALCYGWIDGQTKKYDDRSWLQRFTPRRKRSVWSKRNTGHVARLIKLKKMKPPGLEQVKAAKADGRWDQAYDSPKDMAVPADFLKELAKDKKAKAFFGTLSRANVYAIAWRLQTAKKPETRERRMKTLLTMLGKGEKLH